MATIYNENVTLDVTKKKPVETIKLRRGENGLTNIVANIVYNDAAYDLTGYEVHFCTLNKYKQFTHEPAKVTNASNGVVTYTVTDRVTAIAGETRVAYFEITKGNQVLTSQTIPMYILDDASLTYEEAQEYQNQIDNLLDQLEQGVKEVGSAGKDAAETVSQAKGALSDANSALEKANKAVDNANAATGKANTAAQNADEAAANANSSATNANKAADKANSAAGNADEATAAANAAAKKANDAASRVDDSISDAADATAAANSAATKANSAATSATNATNAANSAASSANTAASDANSAAAAANAAKTAVDTALARYKTIKSSKVDYQLGDSGTTAPTGEWSSTIPDIEQGKYLWVRLVVTFADKENADAGTETVLIPAYQGRDGSFSGEERMTQLEEKVNSVNDFTTGINLIRGSRDFNNGTINAFTNANNLKTDGFYLQQNVGQQIYTDKDGFSVLHHTNYNTVVNDRSSAISGLQPGDNLTLSFDIMFENYVAGEVVIFAYYYTKENIEIARESFTLDKIGLTGNELNTWHSAICVLTVPSGFNQDNDIMFVSIRSNNTKPSFKKFMVQHGEINNPIWAPAPADLSLEPVNDITKGDNLAEGTRDLLTGTKQWGKTGYWTNGATTDGNFSYGRDGAFRHVTIDMINKNVRNVNYVISNNFEAGEIVTVNFEFMINETRGISDNTVIAYIFTYNTTGAGSFQNDVTLSSIGYKASNINTGKWYTATYYYQCSTAISEELGLSVLVRLAAPNDTIASYRKLNVLRGRISNPVWSPAPADLVLEPNNDMTTGVNLLRGTRDFVSGSKNIHNTSSPRYIDGFLLPDDVKLLIDEDGFTLATVGTAIAISSLYPIESDKTFTGYCDVRFATAPESSLIVFRLSVFKKNVSTGVVSQYLTKTIAVNDIISQYGEIKASRWYHLVLRGTFDIPENDNENKYYAAVYIQNGTFKKVGMNVGDIIYPVWSANPFDVVQENIVKASLDSTFNLYKQGRIVYCNINKYNVSSSEISANKLDIVIPDGYKPIETHRAIDSDKKEVVWFYSNGNIQWNVNSSGYLSLSTSWVSAGSVNAVSIIPSIDPPLISVVPNIEQSKSGVDMLPSDGSQFVVEAPNIDSVEDAEEEN